MPRVASLHIHPVKSCRGVDVAELELDARGPVGDRRYMVVDPEGTFRTQRELPSMARVVAHLDPQGVRLCHAGLSDLVATPTNRRLRVHVWEHSGPAADCGDEAAEWLSRALGVECRLVHLPEDALRGVDPRYAAEGGQVAFADAFPLLLTSSAALDALNARLDAPVAMRRFRPNVVIEECEAHAEDGWRRIRIGAIVLDVVKPCERCAVTTVDPDTGGRGKEPLTTLATYRRNADGKVTFGQNAVHRSLGVIRVGEEVEVLD